MGLVGSLREFIESVAVAFKADRLRLDKLEQAQSAKLLEITPSDTTKLAGVASKIYVASGGTIALIKSDGTQITLSVGDKQSCDVGGVVQVLSTGTTATGLVGLIA